MEEIDKKIEEETEKDIHPNYVLTDLLREKIELMGYRLEDQPDGTTKVFKI